MKWLKSFVLVLSAVIAVPGFADTHKVESDGYDVMMDMVLRPVGFVATIIGAGVFVGVSPLTAMAAIPEPHDAFEKLADTLVCKPAKWTFSRPVGDYRYDEGCHSATRQTAAVQPRPTTQPEAAVQLPHDTNKKIDGIFKKQMMK